MHGDGTAAQDADLVVGDQELDVLVDFILAQGDGLIVGHLGAAGRLAEPDQLDLLVGRDERVGFDMGDHIAKGRVQYIAVLLGDGYPWGLEDTCLAGDAQGQALGAASRLLGHFDEIIEARLALEDGEELRVGHPERDEGGRVMAGEGLAVGLQLPTFGIFALDHQAHAVQAVHAPIATSCRPRRESRSAR